MEVNEIIVIGLEAENMFVHINQKNVRFIFACVIS